MDIKIGPLSFIVKTVFIALYLTASMEQVEDAAKNQGTWKKQKEQVAKL